MDFYVHKHILWKPNPVSANKSNFCQFKDFINAKYSLKFETYWDVHTWSCDHYDKFWEAVWYYCDVVHSSPFTLVVDCDKNMVESPQWFHGAELNFAENLLRFDDNNVALYCTGEGQGIITWTFRALKLLVARYAHALHKVGVCRGDRVVGYIPNCCEAIAAMLASASLGAIWSSTSPEFGSVGTLDRFQQIRPKVMFTVNAVRYNAKIHDHIRKANEVTQGLSSLEKVIVIEYIKGYKFDLSEISKSISLDEFLSLVPVNVSLKFEQVPFNHPLLILFSSGTTGSPKCIVHSVGGTLLKHLQEHVIQSGMTRDDIILFYSTTGWMMWNWVVSCLSVGSAIVLYDGSPFIPHANILWDLVDTIGVTIIGSGAKCLSVFCDRKLTPNKTNNLSTLRMILSTGSPLKPSLYDYIYQDVKKEVILSSISGGTDIIGCFMGQTEVLPVYRGEIQAPILGCKVETFNCKGESVLDEPGELVITVPIPSMPIYFWNDPSNTKYHKAYFSKYKGVWTHGDFCQINSATGGIVILGRSDCTLNPNGVRFGSGDIYNIVETFPQITDSICIAQQNSDKSEERVILFIKMAESEAFGDEIVQKIRSSVRESLSARHVPSVIIHVPDIPYTHSGKKVELAVHHSVMKNHVETASLCNPECLEFFKDLKELDNY